MFSRIFGKPKQETNALTTLDKLNEVLSLFYGLLTFLHVFPGDTIPLLYFGIHYICKCSLSAELVNR